MLSDQSFEPNPIRVADYTETRRGAHVADCPWCDGEHYIKYPNNDPELVPRHVAAPCRRHARLRLVHAREWQ